MFAFIKKGASGFSTEDGQGLSGLDLMVLANNSPYGIDDGYFYHQTDISGKSIWITNPGLVSVSNNALIVMGGTGYRLFGSLSVSDNAYVETTFDYYAGMRSSGTINLNLASNTGDVSVSDRSSDSSMRYQISFSLTRGSKSYFSTDILQGSTLATHNDSNAAFISAQKINILSDLSGRAEITAQTASLKGYETITVATDGKRTYSYTNWTTGHSVKAHGYVATEGNIVLGNNFKQNISATSRDSNFLSIGTPTVTDNEFSAYGFYVQSGNLTGANGVWSGNITVSASTNRMFGDGLTSYDKASNDNALAFNNASVSDNTVAAAGVLVTGNIELGTVTNGIISASASGNSFRAEAKKAIKPSEVGKENATVANISSVVSNNTVSARGFSSTGNIVFDNVAYDAFSEINITVSDNSFDATPEYGSYAFEQNKDVVRATGNLLEGYGIYAGGTITSENLNARIVVSSERNTITGASYTSGDANNIALYGIYAATSIHVDGDLSSNISISQNSNNYDLSRLGRSDVYGIYSHAITVSGTIGGNITVNDSGAIEGKYVTSGIYGKSITASAFSGIITMTAVNGFSAALRAEKYISVYNSTDAFDMNGTITVRGQSQSAFHSEHGLNARISGEINAAGTVAVQTNTTSSGLIFFNDRLDFSYSANVTGDIEVVGGTDTLLFNSNATVSGTVLSYSGTTNMIFYLDGVNLPGHTTLTTTRGDNSLTSTNTLTVAIDDAIAGTTYKIISYSDYISDSAFYDALWADKPIAFTLKGELGILDETRDTQTSHYFVFRNSDSAEGNTVVHYEYNRGEVSVTVTETGSNFEKTAFEGNLVNPDPLKPNKNGDTTLRLSGLSGKIFTYEIEYSINGANTIVIRTTKSDLKADSNGSYYIEENIDAPEGSTVYWRARAVYNDYYYSAWSNGYANGDYANWNTVNVNAFIYDTLTMTNSTTFATNPSSDGKSNTAINDSTVKLSWDAATTVNDGYNTVERYTVRFIESQVRMTEMDARAFWEAYDRNGNNASSYNYNGITYTVHRKYTTAETMYITGLTNLHYIYWQVQAKGEDASVSEYIQGDSFRVFVGESSTPEWQQQYSDISLTYNRRDAYNVKVVPTVTWCAASDLESGIKQYIVEFTNTETGKKTKYIFAEPEKNAENFDPETGVYTFTSGLGIQYTMYENNGVTYFQAMLNEMDAGHYTWTVSAEDYCKSSTLLNGTAFGFADVTPPSGKFGTFSGSVKATYSVATETHTDESGTTTIVETGEKTLTGVSLTLDWTQGTSFTDDTDVRYMIEISGDDTFSGTVYTFNSTTTQLILDENNSVSILAGMTTVFWRVKAMDSAGNEGVIWSPTQSLAMIDDDGKYIEIPTELSAPTGLVSSSLKKTEGSSSVYFSWNSAKSDFGVYSYKLTVYNSTGAVAFMVDDLRTTSYTKDSLVDGDYTWTVSATSGQSTVTSESQGVLLATHELAVPELLNSVASNTTICFLWKGVENAKSYTLYYGFASKDEDGNDTTQYQQVSGLTTTSQLLTVSSFGTYNYYVIAVDAYGNRTSIDKALENFGHVDVNESSETGYDTFEKAKNGSLQFVQFTDPNTGVRSFRGNPVEGYLGYSDMTDFYGFETAGSGILADYTIDFSDIAKVYGADSKLSVTVYNSYGVVLGTYSIGEGDYKISVNSQKHQNFYFSVNATYGGTLTGYKFTVTENVYFDPANGGWIDGRNNNDDYFNSYDPAVRMRINAANYNGDFRLNLSYSVVFNVTEADYGTLLNNNIPLNVISTRQDAGGNPSGRTVSYTYTTQESAAHMQARLAGGFSLGGVDIKASDIITSDYSARRSDWVGFGDVGDWTRVSVANAGKYQFDISGITVPVQLYIYGINASSYMGCVTVTPSQAADGSWINSGTSADFALKAGEYYIYVYDPYAGYSQNSNYTVTISGSEYDSSNGYNSFAEARVNASTLSLGLNEVGTLNISDGTDYYCVTDNLNNQSGYVTAEIVSDGYTTLQIAYDVDRNGTIDGYLHGGLAANGSIGANKTSSFGFFVSETTSWDYYLVVFNPNAASGYSSNYKFSLVTDQYQEKQEKSTGIADSTYDFLRVKNVENRVTADIQASTNLSTEADKLVKSIDWVGYGDTSDWMRIAITEDGNYTFGLESDNYAYVYLYNASAGVLSALSANNANGSVVKVSSVAMNLTAGSYYAYVGNPYAANGFGANYTLSVMTNSLYNAEDNNNSDDTLVNAKNYYRRSVVTVDDSKDSFSLLIDGVDANGNLRGYENYVGYGDSTDFVRIHINQGGKYNFTAESDGYAYLYIYKDNGAYLTGVNIANATGGTSKTSDVMLESGDYYLNVGNIYYASGMQTFYNVTVGVVERYPTNIADNTRATASVVAYVDERQQNVPSLRVANSAYIEQDASITANVVSQAVFKSKVITDWVGFGDSVDWKKITISAADAGKYSFQIESDGYASMVIQNAAGAVIAAANAYSAVNTQTVIGKTASVNLAAGDYYVCVTNPYAASGYGTLYSISLTQEKSYRSGDNRSGFYDSYADAWTGRNNGDAIPLSTNSADRSTMAIDMVGFADPQDWITFNVSVNGYYAFSLDSNGYTSAYLYRMSGENLYPLVTAVSAYSSNSSWVTGSTGAVYLTAGVYAFNVTNPYAASGYESDYSLRVNGCYDPNSPDRFGNTVAELAVSPDLVSDSQVSDTVGGAIDTYDYISVRITTDGSYTFMMTSDGFRTDMELYSVPGTKIGSSITQSASLLNKTGTLTANLTVGDYYLKVYDFYSYLYSTNTAAYPTFAGYHSSYTIDCINSANSMLDGNGTFETASDLDAPIVKGTSSNEIVNMVGYNANQLSEAQNDYFRLNVQENGYYAFNLWTDKYAKLVVYGADRTTVLATFAGSAATASASLLLMSGTYYARVTNDYAPYGSAYDSNYKFSVSATFIYKGTNRPGDGYSNIADAIAADAAGAFAGTALTASRVSGDVVNNANPREWVGYGDTIDWTKISVAENGYYGLSLSSDGYAYMQIYNANGTLLNTSYAYFTTGGTNLLLQSGTYYVMVTNPNASAGTGYEANYTLSVSSEKIYESALITTNNTFQDATMLPRNNQYGTLIDTNGAGVQSLVGQTPDGYNYVGYGDDTDIYEFTMGSAGRISFTLDLQGGGYSYLYLYKEINAGTTTAYQLVASTFASNADVSLNNLILENGEYYLKLVNPYANIGDGYKTDYEINYTADFFAATVGYDKSDDTVDGYDTVSRSYISDSDYNGAYMLRSYYLLTYTIASTQAIIDAASNIRSSKAFGNGIFEVTEYCDISINELNNYLKNGYVTRLNGSEETVAVTDYSFVSINSNQNVVFQNDRDWVGYGDSVDYKKFTVNDTGIYTFSLTAYANDVLHTTTYDNAYTVAYIYKENSNGTLSQVTAVGVNCMAGNSSTGTASAVLYTTGNYYIMVTNPNAASGYGAAYDVQVSAKLFRANNTDDTFAKAESLDVSIATGHTRIVTNDWVGYTDAGDFKKFKILNNGSCSISIEADGYANLYIYNGQGTLLGQTSVVGSTGNYVTATTDSLWYSAGTYYLYVVNPYANNGYSTDYSLTINASMLDGDNRDDFIDLLYVKENPVLIDSRVMGTLFSDWVGYQDLSDYRQLCVNETANYTFSFMQDYEDAGAEASYTVRDANDNVIAANPDGSYFLNGGTTYYMCVESKTGPLMLNTKYHIDVSANTVLAQGVSSSVSFRADASSYQFGGFTNETGVGSGMVYQLLDEAGNVADAANLAIGDMYCLDVTNGTNGTVSTKDIGLVRSDYIDGSDDIEINARNLTGSVTDFVNNLDNMTDQEDWFSVTGKTSLKFELGSAQGVVTDSLGNTVYNSANNTGNFLELSASETYHIRISAVNDATHYSMALA